MEHLKLFEEFEPNDVVVVNGKVGKVISEQDGDVVVRFFNPRKIKIVNKDDVNKNNKCLSQCNKKIIDKGDDRYIKCLYCGKEQIFKK